MLGVQLDFKRFAKVVNGDVPSEVDFDELSLPWCGKNAKGKLGTVIACMCGDYAVAGLCLGVASDESEGFPLTTLDPNMDTTEVEKWLQETTLSQFATDPKPKLMIFTHWH